ncbi:MAG TPA: hypothetical protein DF637_01275 [Rikenellaceae bacterium]|nr:hypothetical protein [Rikenellaceae bacterium]
MKNLNKLCVAVIMSASILFSPAIFAQTNKFSAEAFDILCNDVLKEWNLPGMAVVVVKGGETIFLKGYGTTAIDSTGTPITPKTQFVIASTSKAMTAALLATVIDEGKVKWEDTVVNHLPDFKLYDPWVTANFQVRDIMVHKTGFRAYATDDLPHFGYDRDQIFTLLRHIQPTYSFRTTYAYNNAMYTVTAKIIEKYTNMSWDDAIAERIFKPLEMNSSTTGNRSFYSSNALAKGHTHFMDKDTIKTAIRADRERGFRWLSAVAPAGFVISTAEDMGNWLKMHLGKGKFNGKQIISETNHRYLFVPQTISGHDSVTLNNYAQGWTVEQSSNGRLIRHTGLAYGYTAFVGIMPEIDMGIAILTNAGATTNPHMAITREMIEKLKGEDKRDWREFYLSSFTRPRPITPQTKIDTIPQLANIQYLGQFFKEDFGTITISEEENKLMFQLNNVKSELRHKTGNAFNIRNISNIELEFFPGNSNKIDALTLKIGDPIGNFVRIY